MQSFHTAVFLTNYSTHQISDETSETVGWGGGDIEMVAVVMDLVFHGLWTIFTPTQGDCGPDL